MIGSTLKRLLAERHMPAGELSRAVGIPAQTLYSIIRRDNMKIDFDVLLRICAVLGVPVEVFCADAGADAAALPAPADSADWALLGKFRALDEDGRALTELVMDRELERVKRAKAAAEEGREPSEIPAFSGRGFPSLTKLSAMFTPLGYQKSP